MPHDTGKGGAAAGANEGKRRGFWPRIPDISGTKPVFPGSTSTESPKSPRILERENRKSMRREQRRDEWSGR